MPVDLTGLERNKWVTIEHEFIKPTASSPNDQFKIEIHKEHVPEIKAAEFFIDDIAIREIKKVVAAHEIKKETIMKSNLKKNVLTLLMGICFYFNGIARKLFIRPLTQTFRRMDTQQRSQR